MRFYLSQVTRSSISKLYCFLFLALAIYERFAVKIHVYHDAAPGLLKSPSYGLSRTAVYQMVDRTIL